MVYKVLKKGSSVQRNKKLLRQDVHEWCTARGEMAKANNSPNCMKCSLPPFFPIFNPADLNIFKKNMFTKNC